jgi:hypothetical protein
MISLRRKEERTEDECVDGVNVHGYPGSHRILTGLMTIGIQWPPDGHPLDTQIVGIQWTNP